MEYLRKTSNVVSSWDAPLPSNTVLAVETITEIQVFQSTSLLCTLQTTFISLAYIEPLLRSVQPFFKRPNTRGRRNHMWHSFDTIKRIQLKPFFLHQTFIGSCTRISLSSEVQFLISASSWTKQSQKCISFISFICLLSVRQLILNRDRTREAHNTITSSRSSEAKIGLYFQQYQTHNLQFQKHMFHSYTGASPLLIKPNCPHNH